MFEHRLDSWMDYADWRKAGLFSTAAQRTLLAVLAFRVGQGRGWLPLSTEHYTGAGMWMKSWSRGKRQCELNGVWRSGRESRDPLSSKAGLLYSLQQKEGLTRFCSKSLQL